MEKQRQTKEHIQTKNGRDEGGLSNLTLLQKAQILHGMQLHSSRFQKQGKRTYCMKTTNLHI